MKTGQPLILMALLWGAACGRHPDAIDVSAYDFRDTRELVRFVHGHALALQRLGLAGLNELRRDPGRAGGNYVYVYDMNNTCLYHGGMPDLVQKNLKEVTDIDGKSIAGLILEALDNPFDPHGWVHYTWWEPGKFYPVPKSSCHFRATLPDGREVFVGGGLDYPHEERAFIRIAVDSAVALIAAKGSEALDIISDPLSSYQYRDVRVFAFQPGRSPLVSPVLGDSRLDMDLTTCTDEVGHRPFERAVQQLETEPTTWQIFMARSRVERQLVKKILYLRKTALNGEPLFVGAITDLPRTP